MNIIEFEKPEGVIASLGGQTAINLATPLMERGMNIIGAGIDVDVLKRCYKAKYLKGSLNYLVSLIVTVIFLKFYQKITILKKQLIMES